MNTINNPVTIFKNNVIEIYWHVGTGPMSSTGKGIKVKCIAPNPFSKKLSCIYAGWISVSLAIHAGTKTPAYILDAACSEVKAQKNIILQTIITYLISIGMQRRAEEYRQATAKAAGVAVGRKLSKLNSNNSRGK